MKLIFLLWEYSREKKLPTLKYTIEGIINFRLLAILYLWIIICFKSCDYINAFLLIKSDSRLFFMFTSQSKMPELNSQEKSELG